MKKHVNLRVYLPLDLEMVRWSWIKITGGWSMLPGPVDFEQLWLERLLALYSTTTSSARAPLTARRSA
jgi:hypothetical protein